MSFYGPASKPLRAAAYARYSTNRQTENSIEYQFNKIKEYCHQNRIQVVSYYSDEGQSGTNMDRAGFIDMVAAAARGEFDAVVIYDISRGSRDVGDWFAFRKQMARLGVQVISATQELGDVTNPNDFLVELITVGLGEHQVLDTRVKSIAGTTVRAKKGLFCGGVPPLGYDIVDGKYIINNAEAAAVRKIFELYAAGKGYSAILEAVKGINGKRGSALGKNSLSSILRNERYIGVYTWLKRRCKLMRKWAGGTPNPDAVRIEGVIPPIIDEKTWNEVQKRMSDNKRRASNKAKQEYLLSGLIECEACGSTYVGHCSTNSKGYQTRSYICGNKYRTHTCTVKNISANEIEAFVIQQLQAFLLETDFAETSRKIADQVNSASPDLTAERRELNGVIAKISNGTKAILSGINYPELQDEMDKLRLRKSELEDIIWRTQSNRQPVSGDKIEKLLNEALETLPADPRAAIKQLVTKIYAHVDGSFTVNVGVHIAGCGGLQPVATTTDL
ncbi:recombinase family protein [Anaeromassilibacillus senegalensis]|uniref:recombinase family protein n=1 Tax=Anaeromassilibacillus senegalensis TaxID=1673717 RepID=UPI000681B3AF|nr:recombinase family protein [Anaeromassilibacillus senegalensis]